MSFTNDELQQMKVKYSHTLIELLFQPDCEQMKAKWQVLNDIDKQFDNAGLQTVISISVRKK